MRTRAALEGNDQTQEPCPEDAHFGMIAKFSILSAAGFALLFCIVFSLREAKASFHRVGRDYA